MQDTIVKKIVGFEHLHVHTSYSILDGFSLVSELGDYLPKINQKYMCITDHGMMAAIPSQIKVCEENNLQPIFGCLPAGHKIHILNRQDVYNPKPKTKDISEIKIGDLVLTHKGRYRFVTGIMKKLHKGLIYSINVSNQITKMTGEHPILIFKNKELKWINASDLQDGYVCVPKIINNTIDEFDLVDENYVYKPIKEITSEYQEVEVFNFEVEKDNSYVTNFAVHNCELYLQNNHPPKDIFLKMTGEEKRTIRKSYHLLAIAFNETGYRNLIQLSSWAWENGYYYKPRVTHEQLKLHKEGIIFTSCCYNSEIGQAFEKGGEDAAYAMIEKYMEMFGENFYLEIMLLDFKKQKPYDAFLIKAHDKYGIDLILSNDSHVCYKEDSKFQHYMLMVQKKTTIKDIERKLSEEDKEDIFELQDTNLWMKSEEELNQKWIEMYSDVIPYDLFTQAKLNTIKICEKAKGVQIDKSPKLPILANEKELLKEELIKGMKWRGIINKRKYIDRLKEEYELICRKGFASYFLICKKLVDEGQRVCFDLTGFTDENAALSCGRGSGCSSLVAYCLNLTQIDPIKHSLLFSRFINESRGGKSIRLKFRN